MSEHLNFSPGNIAHGAKAEGASGRCGPGAPEARPERQWVEAICQLCGHKVCGHLGHYEQVQCRCGRMFWALQPKAGGALELFPILQRQIITTDRHG